MNHNKKYKTTIIGAGSIAASFDGPEDKDILTYAHAITDSKNFELNGFYDIDYRKASEAAKKWKGKAFDSFEKAMKGTDVVCICVPDQYHYEVLKRIIKYEPLHVIAEKPLCRNVEEAGDICNLYADVPVFVNYSRRYIPEVQELRNEIITYGKLLKGVGFYGKGTLHNGSHMIDLIRFLLGEIRKKEFLNLGINDYSSSDLTKDLKMELSIGTIYMLGVDSRCVTEFELELLFEKKKIRILDGGLKIEKYDIKESRQYKGYYNYKLVEVIDVDYSKALENLFDSVARHLRGEQVNHCSVKDATRAIEICVGE